MEYTLGGQIALETNTKIHCLQLIFISMIWASCPSSKNSFGQENGCGREAGGGESGMLGALKFQDTAAGHSTSKFLKIL